MTLLGVDDVIGNLNQAIRHTKGRTLKGIRAALLLFKAESMSRTPVDTGNLRAGHYIDVGMEGNEPQGVVGVQADYAVPVHENLNVFHPVGEAKYLEKAVKAKAGAALRVIQRHAKV